MEASERGAQGWTDVQREAFYRALRAVAEASGGAVPSALTLAHEALGVGSDTAPTPSIRALGGALATAFPRGVQRRDLLNALVTVACLGGGVSERAEQAVTEIARALGTKTPWVELLPALRKRAASKIRFALMRRSPDARALFQRIWREEGLRGVLRAALFVVGLFRDPALAKRFRGLKDLPAGTFGRAFYEHMATRGLSFPGEKGGVPEKMVHHDLMHVLAGYDTDAPGECEIGGLYAAMTGEDGWTYIMTALTTFEMGMAVSPAAVVATRGQFDPARVFDAFVRGSRMTVNVTQAWDYWALFPRPLDEARAAIGLVPRAPAVGSQPAATAGSI